MLRTVLATITGLAAMGAVSAVLAMPLPAAPSATAAPLAEPIHGCHHGLLRDRRGTGVYGWHFHDRACLRHDAPPPGYSDNRGLYGYYRTPVCRYRCGFIGPVKHCEQTCR